jgi:hypothetical protein
MSDPQKLAFALACIIFRAYYVRAPAGCSPADILQTESVRHLVLTPDPSAAWDNFLGQPPTTAIADNIACGACRPSPPYTIYDVEMKEEMPPLPVAKPISPDTLARFGIVDAVPDDRRLTIKELKAILALRPGDLPGSIRTCSLLSQTAAYVHLPSKPSMWEMRSLVPPMRT